MIRGAVDKHNACYIDLKIAGTTEEVSVQALTDTGFEGYVCLPISLAVPLGLALIGIIKTELADGTVLEDELLFAGKAFWHNKYVDVEIILTRSDQTLVGTALLSDSEVIINFPVRTLKIKKRS